MQKAEHSYNPPGKPYFLQLGVYWLHRDHPVDRQAMLKMARKLEATAYVKAPANTHQFGVSFQSSSTRKYYSAAYLIAQEHQDKTIIAAVEIPRANGKIFWLVGVQNGQIIIDTDLLCRSAEELCEYAATLAARYPEATIYAPETYNLKAIGPYPIEQINIDAAGTLTTTKTSTERMTASLQAPRLRRPLAIAGICALGAIAYLGLRPDNTEAPVITSVPDTPPTAEELEQLAIEARPWLGLPPAVSIVHSCIERGLAQLLPVPGWTLEKFECEGEEARAIYNKSPGALIRTLRLVYQVDTKDKAPCPITASLAVWKDQTACNYFLSLDGNSTATVRYKLPELARAIDARTDEYPLLRIDATQYLVDMFEPLAGTVKLEPYTGGTFAQSASFDLYQVTITTPLQPQQWAAEINRIPTLHPLKIVSTNLEEFTWEIQALIFLQKGTPDA